MSETIEKEICPICLQILKTDLQTHIKKSHYNQKSFEININDLNLFMNKVQEINFDINICLLQILREIQNEERKELSKKLDELNLELKSIYLNKYQEYQQEETRLIDYYFKSFSQYKLSEKVTSYSLVKKEILKNYIQELKIKKRGNREICFFCFNYYVSINKHIFCLCPSQGIYGCCKVREFLIHNDNNKQIISCIIDLLRYSSPKYKKETYSQIKLVINEYIKNKKIILEKMDNREQVCNFFQQVRKHFFKRFDNKNKKNENKKNNDVIYKIIGKKRNSEIILKDDIDNNNFSFTDIMVHKIFSKYFGYKK